MTSPGHAHGHGRTDEPGNKVGQREKVHIQTAYPEYLQPGYFGEGAHPELAWRGRSVESENEGEALSYQHNHLAGRSFESDSKGDVKPINMTNVPKGAHPQTHAPLRQGSNWQSGKFNYMRKSGDVGKKHR